MSELVKFKLGVEDTHNAYDATNDRYTFVISGRWFVNFRGQKYQDFFRAGDTLYGGLIEAHLIGAGESGYTLTKDGFNEPLKRKGAGVSNRDICLCGQMFSAHNKNFCITNVNGNEDKMSTFKNIKKLGLSITTWGGDPRTSAVLAQELETLLQSAQVVYGSPDTPSDQLAWSNTQLDCDTHKALLLAVEPIKKKTKAEAALEFIKKCKDGDIYEMHSNEVMAEAKQILEMKDET